MGRLMKNVPAAGAYIQRTFDERPRCRVKQEKTRQKTPESTLGGHNEDNRG